MREIKFRAWDKEKKVMLPAWSVWKTNLFDYECKADLILMQFTGLHDKNGKEIYEGDVIKWDKNIEGLWPDQVGKKEIVTFPFVCGNAYLGVVIGNIYENPELLKAKETQK